MPRNIIQGCNWLTLANTVAYNNATIITAVKSFIVQAPGDCYNYLYCGKLQLFYGNILWQQSITIIPWNGSKKLFSIVIYACLLQHSKHMALKCFKVQAPGARLKKVVLYCNIWLSWYRSKIPLYFCSISPGSNAIKLFTAVIYEC